MNSNKRFVIFILTLIIIALLSGGVVFFAQGYRLSGLKNLSNRKAPLVEGTGMLVVKSYPDGARLYIDEKLEGPTNASTGDLTPGIHKVRIVKEGYFEYTKTVEVYQELVTVVEALLIPLSPTLSPITYSGVRESSLSPSGNVIVYAGSGNGEPGGIFKLDLASSLRSSLLASDRTGIMFSMAQEFHWSPNESEVLVKVGAQYYLLSLSVANLAPRPLEAEPVLLSWESAKEKRDDLKLSKYKLSPKIQQIATASSTLWASNEKRFLYEAFDPTLDTIQYRVYSLLDPRPVGEKEDYIAFEKSRSDSGVKDIFWYGDGRHLVIVEEKRISIKEIDGESSLLLFSGDFDKDHTFPRPGGGGVIILTRFNEEAPLNFYLLGL